MACSSDGSEERDLPLFGNGGNQSGSGGAPPGTGGGTSGVSRGGSGGAGANGGASGAPAAGGSGSALGMGGSAMVGSGGTGNGMAGSGMGTISGPTSALCPAGSAFCEDFEDDAVDQVPAAPWQDATNGSAVVRVSATRAFSGQRSLLANAATGANYRRAYVALQQSNFAGASQNMFGRVMVWLEAAPAAAPGSNPVHWTLFQGEGRDAANTYNGIYRFGGQQQNGAGLMANYETTPPVRSDCYQHSNTRIPVQQWACIEWHFVQANNEMQYWLNGSELSDIHVVDRAMPPAGGCVNNVPPLSGQWLAPPNFQTLYLGWEQYQPATNAVNVWLDGVVVSTTRVLCPALQ